MLRVILKTLQDINAYLRAGSLFASEWAEVPGIAAADALDANDAVGTPFKIKVPRKGRILSAKLIDLDDDTLAFTAHVYGSEFAGAASDAAYSVNKAFGTAWATNIVFASSTDEGGFKALEALDVNAEYYAPSGYLWVQMSTTGTPTIAANAMPQMRLFILPL